MNIIFGFIFMLFTASSKKKKMKILKSFSRTRGHTLWGFTWNCRFRSRKRKYSMFFGCTRKKFIASLLACEILLFMTTKKNQIISSHAFLWQIFVKVNINIINHSFIHISQNRKSVLTSTYVVVLGRKSFLFCVVTTNWKSSVEFH